MSRNHQRPAALLKLSDYLRRRDDDNNNVKHLSFNILVIGAGPAGLAAAISASQSTTDVGLIDDNPEIGGQTWRTGAHNLPNEQAKYWFALASTSNLTILTGTKIIAHLKSDTLLAETATEALEMQFKRLILATGARELFLPFLGWTLPGVMGAGGLQALVKGGLPIAGKRVVVAGSGPLLLAVAAYLKSKGAHIQAIVEQASRTKLGKFVLHLPFHTNHIGQAGNLAWHLLGTPIYTGSWVQQAHGTDHLQSVTLCHHNHISELPCDYLACGFGLIPNTELPAVLGCAVENGVVQVNEWQQTSIETMYCVGEATGIGGLDLALLEGQIAGFAAADKQEAARAFFSARDRARHFAALLAHSFALRDELKTLADDNTIVCRCEDVPYYDVKQYKSWRSAKLNMRCGMGPCQGRICGAATTFLFGWGPDSMRPPVTPGRIASFAQIDTDPQHTEEARS
jgi:NADPH-dependent 2,4-dienoyl-CoA reductase/sulfur reductase-like enzyme